MIKHRLRNFVRYRPIFVPARAWLFGQRLRRGLPHWPKIMAGQRLRPEPPAGGHKEARSRGHQHGRSSRREHARQCARGGARLARGGRGGAAVRCRPSGVHAVRIAHLSRPGPASRARSRAAVRPLLRRGGVSLRADGHPCPQAVERDHGGGSRARPARGRLPRTCPTSAASRSRAWRSARRRWRARCASMRSAISTASPTRSPCCAAIWKPPS